jgi:hypothetical protein
VSSSGNEPVRGSAPDLGPLLALVDVSLGVTSILAELTLRSVRTTRDLAAPVLRRVERLPGVRTASAALASSPLRRGASVRGVLVLKGPRAVDLVVPLLLEQVLRRVDLADVVHRHVDLDRIVAEVDIDAVASRLDIDTVAARLDIDAVAARLDLATLVTAALAQVDLVAIAEQVIDAVDLPEIIRESSGALTSDTVRGTRMRSAAADQALARVRDRFLPHRDGARHQAVPSVPAAAVAAPALGAPNASGAPGAALDAAGPELPAGRTLS